jgi:hypothetical protein
MRWTTPQQLCCNPARLGIAARTVSDVGPRPRPAGRRITLRSCPRLDLPPTDSFCTTLPVSADRLPSTTLSPAKWRGALSSPCYHRVSFGFSIWPLPS